MNPTTVPTPDDCSGGDCLRIKHLPSGRRLLWSTRRVDEGEFVMVDADEWADFIARVKAGEFDDPGTG